MTAERCGLGSLLPVSCRGRAEAFARRLQSRLRTLGRGTDDEPGASGTTPGTDEYDELLDGESWKTSASTSNTMHETQPIVSPNNSDRFFDFDLEETSNPGSPINESEEEVLGINTNDGLQCCESGCVLASPSSNDMDSDSSDGQYFDPLWSDVFADAFSALVPAPPSSQNSIKEESISDDTLTSQNSILLHHNTDNDNGSLNNELCQDVLMNDMPSNNSCHESQASSSNHCSTNNNNSIEEDVRQCIEKLCIDIISQAELEVAKILTQKSHTSIASPKVVISKVESIDQNCQNEHCIKTKEEINTLFECLSIKEPKSDESSDISTPEEDKPRRVQRSSSLKTGKTPPGTPGRKKIVRFADVLGLDLADVRTFMDDIPKVPSSAYWDLDDSFRKRETTPPMPTKCLVPMFQQPGGSPEFLERVRTNKVCLENAFQSDSLSITGTVRVLNIDFHKSVYIRYTLDNWNNFADLQASYVPGSSDGFSDKFSFVLYAHTLDIGQRIEFAIRYSTAGQQFWDSNGGVNYVFQCLNSTAPVQTNFMASRDSSSPESESWSSFY